jgi:hypothetical protein
MSKTVKYNEKKHKNRKWDKLNNKTKKNKRLFSKENYNSGDGMLTSVWGPSMWHYLHIMSFNYPLHPTKEEKNHYREFVLNLQNVLPCKYCRNNLKKNFKTLPLKMSNMENRETFSRYIYNLHELINKMLNKKSGLSYNDVRERYEYFRSRCNPSKILKEVKKEEKGCTDPLNGKKSKCIIKIVSQHKKGETFQMDNL